MGHLARPQPRHGIPAGPVRTQDLKQKGPQGCLWWKEPFTSLARGLLHDLRDVVTAERLALEEGGRGGNALAIDRALTGQSPKHTLEHGQPPWPEDHGWVVPHDLRKEALLSTTIFGLCFRLKAVPFVSGTVSPRSCLTPASGGK